MGVPEGLLAFALPAIFWEETELSSNRREVAGFEVPSASHPGPLCHTSDLDSTLGAGARLHTSAPAAWPSWGTVGFPGPRGLLCKEGCREGGGSHEWGEPCLPVRVIAFHLPTVFVS